MHACIWSTLIFHLVDTVLRHRYVLTERKQILEPVNDYRPMLQYQCNSFQAIRIFNVLTESAIFFSPHAISQESCECPRKERP